VNRKLRRHCRAVYQSPFTIHHSRSWIFLSSGATEVLIATDHPDIAAAAAQYGFEAVMTRVDHASGTDRVAEVAAKRGYAGERIVVNLQGDEPLISPQLIREVALSLSEHPNAAVSTACHPIHDAADIANPNVVKVALDSQGYALYFSRAPIPYARDAFSAGIIAVPPGLPAYRHIGIYGYRAGFLGRYARLEPSSLEQFEALEQLRVLWHGYKISVAITPDAAPPGIDTPEDLQRIKQFMHKS
jgi:3-deoxy-manno-octulosonate cytidylyltransferase (CMP-KDO synthetase)